MKRALTLLTVLLAAVATGAAAQDRMGQEEYRLTCAACHGATGAGDGPLASVLTVDVPALTGLAAAHGGTFPVMQTLMAIDGRVPLAGHGGAMPVWGERYQQAAEAVGGPLDAAMIARGRLLSLVYYLETIQQ